MSTHYSTAQMPVMLVDQASDIAFLLSEVMQEKKHEKHRLLLAYSGMSGIATATALMLQLHREYPNIGLDMAYFRKADEKSHGLQIETTLPWVPTGTEPKYQYVCVFVDDFCSLGNTLKRVVDAIQNEGCNRRFVQNKVLGVDYAALFGPRSVTPFKEKILTLSVFKEKTDVRQEW